MTYKDQFLPAKRGFIEIAMKKENLIVIFYVLYFAWLFTVTYLTPEPPILNYFTLGVAAFYFIFLRGENDLFWFLLGSSVAFAIVILGIGSGRFQLNFSAIKDTPIWLPIAWGTTFVTLRKLFVLVAREI